jgi:hypothetical protein
MVEIDRLLSGAGFGSLTIALLAALLLGLRHATDPDHLAAVSALVVPEGASGSLHRALTPIRSPGGTWAGRASGLGFCWGMGHAATLFAFGVPVILLGRQLPDRVLAGAEVLAGVLIVLLAGRLLRSWRRGSFGEGAGSGDRAAVLRPAGGTTATLPVGEAVALAAEVSGTPRGGGAPVRGRTPVAAFGIGLVHGVGGSAAVGILVVANASDSRDAMLALAVFALGTAVAMASLSGLMGGALAHRAIRSRLERLVPTLGVACLAFGVWYALSAAGLAP